MKASKKPIEQRVAETILQKPEQVSVGGVTYDVPPPSVATLILVSEQIAKLPPMNAKSDDVAGEVFAKADQCRPLGDIAATLILGAKRLKEQRTVAGRFGRRHVETVDRKAELSQRILEELSPAQLSTLITQLLNRMEIGDFFGITTFLSAMNLLRPSREVETAATASGR